MRMSLCLPEAAITHGTPERFAKTADSGRTLHRFVRIGTLDDAPPMTITTDPPPPTRA